MCSAKNVRGALKHGGAQRPRPTMREGVIAVLNRSNNVRDALNCATTKERGWETSPTGFDKGAWKARLRKSFSKCNETWRGTETPPYNARGCYRGFKPLLQCENRSYIRLCGVCVFFYFVFVDCLLIGGIVNTFRIAKFL